MYAVSPHPDSLRRTVNVREGRMGQLEGVEVLQERQRVDVCLCVICEGHQCTPAYSTPRISLVGK